MKNAGWTGYTPGTALSGRERQKHSSSVVPESVFRAISLRSIDLITYIDIDGILSLASIPTRFISDHSPTLLRCLYRGVEETNVII